MDGSSESAARPTLWRTCRVLANRLRLRMFRHLIEQPDQPVSEVAKHMGVSRPVASQYLRALNARGLLAARREGRWVLYRPHPDSSIREARPLLAALQRTFPAQGDPVDTIFRLVTAFTHPRRQDIYRSLHDRELTFGELRTQTGISVDALRRHLAKLQDRGFVRSRADVYEAIVPEGELARTLSRLAVSASR